MSHQQCYYNKLKNHAHTRIIQFVSYYPVKNILKPKHYGATVALESFALNCMFQHR